MTKKRTSEETRTLIFQSCSHILSTEGASSLTLDAVARKAGLSKGGLLYHFPTKEALVEAVFNHYIDKFNAQIEQLLQENGRDWLNAYMMASIDQITEPETARLFASLFAAGDQYPGVLDAMRQHYDQWQAKVEATNLPPTKATLIRLIIDGLWFSEMYQYAPPSPRRRQKLINLINQMIKEG